MTLRDLMALHARGMLTATEHFGESITYKFKSGDPDRTFDVVINRLDIEPDLMAGEVGKLKAIVAIPVHDTLGVTSVAKGDRINMAMKIGGASYDCRVTSVISQDEGMFIVEAVA